MSNKSLAKRSSELTILVTGGAGFIGSHTVVELIERGFHVVVLDDLSNSNPKAIFRVAHICKLVRANDASLASFFESAPNASNQQDASLGTHATHATDTMHGAHAAVDLASQASFLEFKNQEGDVVLTFIKGSVCDRALLEKLFSKFDIDAIIHFAGFKAVGESVQKPLEYYSNNIGGTLELLDVARRHGVKNFVFSSSATVYGDPESVPMTENSPKNAPTNPYGWTKSMLEQILTDMYTGDDEFNIALLRYFNPIGAHESGLIGEDPLGIPNNLVPYVAQVAVGNLPEIGVYGDDYPTPDGTGVRDYIHVVDLARGHVAALDWLGGKKGSSDDPEDWGSIAGVPAADGTRRGVGIFNLGTGTGSSVLDVIKSFSKACGRKLPYKIKPRRAGDIAVSYASCDKAARELGWLAEYDLDKMCEDSWRWQSNNPEGYE